MAEGRNRRRAGVIGVFLLAGIVVGVQVWRDNNTPERNCERARWATRGKWEEAVERLNETHQRLLADDAKMAAQGQLDPTHLGRWRMWVDAQNAAEQALASVYEDPLSSRKHAMTASSACRLARETSPSVQQSGAMAREYKPGGRALKTCASAAQQSERVWEACSYMVVEVPAGGAGEVDLNFFDGCNL